MRQRGVGSSEAGFAATEPLKPSTVNKRFTALIRLIGFAATQLPEGTQFTVPDMEAHKKYCGWALPPAHANPRQRMASNQELAAVLHAAAPESDLGQLLQTQDETGCRLGEVLHARGAQVTAFFDESGQLFGGTLHLPTHKTFYKTSRNAAVLELVQRMPPQAPQDCSGRAKAQDWQAFAVRIPLPCPSAEVLALARALGTYDQCFNFA
jgi:hypothetical protein